MFDVPSPSSSLSAKRKKKKKSTATSAERRNLNSQEPSESSFPPPEYCCWPLSSPHLPRVVAQTPPPSPRKLEELEVVLVHRYFDVSSGGIRALLLYYGVTTHFVEMELPETVQEAGDLAKATILPVLYILEPEEEGAGMDENVEDGKARKMTGANASALEPKSFRDRTAYCYQGSVEILEALYPYLSCDDDPSLLASLTDVWNLPTPSDQTRLLLGVPRCVFTHLVGQPGMVETYVRHYVGKAEGGVGIKYGAADIVTTAMGRMSAQFPQSFVEQMAWYMQRREERQGRRERERSEGDEIDGNMLLDPIDVRLYGCFLTAMIVAEDWVRRGPPTREHSSWICDDLQSAGAWEWFQSVDQEFKRKVEGGSQAVIPEFAVHKVCRSFYGSS